jgi:putative DNA primase/helicase
MNAPNDLLATLRVTLHRNGYHPVPVSDPNPMLSKAGKAPLFKDWHRICAVATEADVALWTTSRHRHGNTGLLCGLLVGMDLDIPVPDLAAEIEALADAMLPATPLVRIGKAPKSCRFYRTDEPLAKAETPELILPCGTTVQVEAMGDGQQVVGFGIHPGTKAPYRWPQNTPENVPLADLPLVTAEARSAFLVAAEAVLRKAGGRTEKEIKAAAREAAQEAKADATKSKNAGGSGFFEAVNAAALANIQPWFCGLFPKARQQSGTGCWRVSSADLGRGLEEDISVHPQKGGHDFGTRQPCSPIDLVMEHGGAPTAKDAALLICEQLGKSPADMGWKEPRIKKERAPRQPTGKPLITVEAGELHTMASAAEDAIIGAGEPIYQRGNSLVRPVTREAAASHGRTTLAAALADVGVPGLVDVLCRVSEWERYDARAEAMVRTNPPRQVAEILLSRAGFWRVPVVVGVVTTPTMRPDGSILSAPGYDAATRLFHAADPGLTLHPAVQNPSRADAEKALALLGELLARFPLVNDVARAVAISAIVTPVVRGTIPVAPMHLFRAPTAGSGKSYLADVVSVIVSGRLCPVITAAPEEAETEKRLVGLLLAGFPLVSIDNVAGELGGDLLCQAIERQFIRVRALGRSDIVEIESRATMLGTGNNARVRGDMVRRTLISDLDAGMERPETRIFTTDPVATIQGERSRYVSACIIVVRAYLLAGQPGKLSPIASFAEWSGLVRSALVWLGCADPAKSMEQAREDDPELDELQEMLEAWWDAHGSLPVTVRESIEVATTLKPVTDEQGNMPEHHATLALPYPSLRDALLRVASVRGEIGATRLGHWLRSRVNRPIAGRRFRQGAKDRSGAATWKVEETSG